MLYIILIIIIIILFSLLYLRKREIQSIINQLKDISENQSKKIIDVTFVDEDITSLASEINKNISIQRQQQLEVLKKELQLKETISNISHDLRTPLTSIIGYLQLLKKQTLNEQQEEYVEIVLSRSLDLRKLINEFYEISYIQSKEGIVNWSEINLDNLIGECILEYTDIFEKLNITPRVNFLDKPTDIIADKTFLKRIIDNLLTNVVRYGSENIVITIIKTDRVMVQFENTIEHPEDIEVEKIFDRSYTADNSRNKSGTGLGLFIVKLLMEKMEGSVSAQIENNSFIITLLFK